MALFGWLVASQPAVLFSHTSSAPANPHICTGESEGLRCTMSLADKMALHSSHIIF
jgi:hypothetical protein